MNKVDAPVWITGKVLGETNRSITVVALDKHDRLRTVSISRPLLKETRQQGADTKFLIPQWLAYKEKLEWTNHMEEISYTPENIRLINEAARAAGKPLPPTPRTKFEGADRRAYPRTLEAEPALERAHKAAVFKGVGVMELKATVDGVAVRNISTESIFKESEKMNLHQYQELAMRTAKIMPELDMLVHGAMGVSSEAGELAEAVMKAHKTGNMDYSNFIEELGDGMWFAAYCAAALGLWLGDVVATSESGYEPPSADPLRAITSSTLDYCAAGAEVCTLVKAHRFYNKTLDRFAVEAALVRYVHAAYSLCAVAGLPIPMVLKYNVEKLRKRYAEKYSDEAAIARADKAVESPATHVQGAFDALPGTPATEPTKAYVNQDGKEQA